ncbi:class II aldolase/adducin family protein [Streptomyces sp. NPDC059740]|uniref:class II aldolase/adducin family protein n=1 Tax=Streptomyces sp. NPDC059740 TaxID=3346926 RepID=UPI003652155C
MTHPPADHRAPRPTAGAPDPGRLAALWRQVVTTARRTAAEGLVVGTSGNVSARLGDVVLLTPSGIPYDRLGPHDAVGLDLTGRQVLGEARPTSEAPLHLAVYRATRAAAVVHTHAVHATAAATLTDVLPPIHYMAADLGGPVRTAAYALYGTEELAAAVLTALEGRTGCLMRNHGALTYGADLDQAFDRTAQLEWMCRVWLTARSGPGTPTLLTPGQLADAARQLGGYGQGSATTADAPATGQAPAARDGRAAPREPGTR